MPTISDHIINWASKQLRYWEQAALDHVLDGKQITDELIDELLDYLLEDAGLKDRQSQRPALIHLSQDCAQSLEYQPRLRLKRIYNLQNINALVPNQVLEFGPDLTLIFGANGSGKSGYARVIGSAAFTRGDKQILPNVTAVQPAAGTMTADLDLETEDGQELTIHYTVGEACPQLKSFYVFDSTSVKNHLTRENPMSFSPAGLEALTHLSNLTDQVRKRLDERCNQKRSTTNLFLPLFIGDSPIRTQIAALGPTTDLAVLEELASVSEAEQSQITALELRIAEIRSAKVAEQIRELTEKIDDLEKLIRDVEGISVQVDDGEVETINGLIRDWMLYDRASKETSLEEFEGGYFSQIGSDAWQRFIQAAYTLGMAESASYPKVGDHCLLCHQPLEDEARDLIQRIWTHLQSRDQSNLESTQASLKGHIQRLSAIDLECLDDQNVAYRHLKAAAPEALQGVQDYLQACQSRCQRLLQAIQAHEPAENIPLPDDGLDAVRSVIAGLQQHKDELEQQNREEEISRLEGEKRKLEHRLVLADHLEGIRDYVANAKWIKQAESPKVRRSTKHITQKYGELFDQLVTQEYLRLFEQSLVRLNCPLKVKVVTRSGKGETRKQLVLMREDNQSQADVSPDKVLSEGEKRAVALADFLTEVALDENSCGILLDDPVTSLDYQWKETIAKHIVEEARCQQVIVFTHDLHFLYLLKNSAEECSVGLVSHWIQKRDDAPGLVFLGNSPVSEKEYKSPQKAREYLQRAKAPGISVEEEQLMLEAGFGALRTTYEAFIMFELFGGVVLRFEERISGDRLKSVYIDETIRDEVIESIARLSRYITAHLHSDSFAAQKPTVKILEEEICYFDQLKQRNKQIKRARGINN